MRCKKKEDLIKPQVYFSFWIENTTIRKFTTHFQSAETSVGAAGLGVYLLRLTTYRLGLRIGGPGNALAVGAAE
jgi:hypothetical protein